MAGFSKKVETQLARWIATARAKRRVTDDDLARLERLIETLKGEDSQVSGSILERSKAKPRPRRRS